MSSTALNHAIDVVMREHQIALQDQGSMKVLLASEWIAGQLPLPTQVVDQPKSFFLAQHKLSVIDWLTRLNEAFVFDVDNAVELVYEIWKIRYALVFEGPTQRYGRLLCGVNLSLSGALSEPYNRLAKEYPAVFVRKGALEQ